ncbi:hypothetical protein AB0M02_16015 [Actinoplanes sp. NPDC051861]|uniref:hypothetical protein n=1 Tax=Actinoplanes sp. NPDC051861 TaxID=3155170 RepID=UPI00342A19C8
MKTEMEPTSSPDNTRPSPGLARFWQVRPETEAAAGEPEIIALGSPSDLLTGAYGVRPAVPIPPDKPAADPFGLNRAAGRATPGPPRGPAGGRPSSGPPARSRHGDTDHSVPPDEEAGPAQDVKSLEPENRDGSFGGFGLGGRLSGTGRFLFGGRNGTESEDSGRSGDEETPGQPDSPAAETETEAAKAEVAEAAEQGDSPVADHPADEQSAGATPAEDPAEETPPEADDQDAAATAGPSDENGREDMNGRAGAPGYTPNGEAPGVDGKPVPPPPGLHGDAGEESPAGSPADIPRPAAGWAQVPTSMVPTTPEGPVSGVPVSPGYAPGSYGVPDFTPDHAAGTLTPVSGQPAQAAAPVDPAANTPVSPAQLPSVQIPATRTPPDSAVRAPETQQAAETPDNGGYAGLPQSADGGFGFSPTGYSLGRSGEALGVASVTPVSPHPGLVTPPPPEFQAYPATIEAGVTGLAVGGAGRRAHQEPEAKPAPRRSASLEDLEPVRRGGRRASREEDEPVADLGTGEPQITRTIWDEDAARHFRAAWHEVKAEFVDDPVTALTRAHDLLTDAVNELTEVLLAERDELDPLRGTDTPDTESMRMAMRGYREYLDRILSL